LVARNQENTADVTTANADQAITLRAAVRDTWSNLVASATEVTFNFGAAEPGAADPGQATTTTSAVNGYATLTGVVQTVAAATGTPITYSVVEIGGNPAATSTVAGSSLERTVTWTPGAFSAASSTIAFQPLGAGGTLAATTSATSTVEGATSTGAFTVQLRDQHGNNLAGGAGQIIWRGPAGELQAPITVIFSPTNCQLLSW
jgi:hypothetical protein